MKPDAENENTRRPIPVVEFQKVDFSYDGPLVLENATFSIGRGEFVSIIGPNGGGKTTLLKLILGLLKPKRGEIRLFDALPQSNRSRIGYTPQFLAVDFSFPLSVLDVVLMGRIRAKRLWYTKEDRAAALDALRVMQLERYADAPFRTLSGGQRQRILIARAICGQPEILLLDEPTNNIDRSSERILSDILADLNRTMTIIMVSHDIGFVSRCVQNVICVNKTVETHSTSELGSGTIHDLYHQSDLRFVRHGHH